MDTPPSTSGYTTPVIGALTTMIEPSAMVAIKVTA